MVKLVKKVSVFLTLVVAIAFVNAIAYGSDDVVATYAPNIKQVKSNWCWNASGVAVLGSKGNLVSQQTFSQIVKGNSTNNDPASMYEVRSGLNHYGYSGNITGSLDAGAIASEIRADRPIIAGYIYNRGGGHMVVISGYDYSDYVEVMDPGVGSKIVYNKSYFTSNSNWTWEESIRNIK